MIWRALGVRDDAADPEGEWNEIDDSGDEQLSAREREEGGGGRRVCEDDEGRCGKYSVCCTCVCRSQDNGRVSKVLRCGAC